MKFHFYTSPLVFRSIINNQACIHSKSLTRPYTGSNMFTLVPASILNMHIHVPIRNTNTFTFITFICLYQRRLRRFYSPFCSVLHGSGYHGGTRSHHLYRYAYCAYNYVVYKGLSPERNKYCLSRATVVSRKG